MADADMQFIKQAYENYYKSLWGYAYFLSHDDDISSDVVQTVFANIIKHSSKLESYSERRLNAYLMISVKNTYLNYLRENKKQTSIIQKLETVSVTKTDADYSSFFNQDLLSKLKTVLSEREKEIICLAYDLDMKRSDIAELMGTSENNIYVTISQSVKKLRAEYQRIVGGEKT